MKRYVFEAFLLGAGVSMLALFSQLTIPLPLVPITGQTLAVGIVAVALGSRRGVLTVLSYIGLGVAGVPVFSDGGSGMYVLLGPSGGYIWGFLPAALVMGLIVEKWSPRVGPAFVANLLGMGITLCFGFVQLMVVLQLEVISALQSGVYPFLVTGILKAGLAAIIGGWLKSFLFKGKGESVRTQEGKTKKDLPKRSLP
ncbi:biotin transporter BioY [Shouchella shacheensis]|uniref:biotin transporter BioY n=1 Tax=Shouchella shacheensis TaxID=1649580 RepID=UPI000B33253E|nr:biotin transporter BioY [Shouchella shacheensis]